MTKLPLLAPRRLRVPAYVLATEAQRRAYVQDYCRAVLAVYLFCTENATAAHLDLSLNAFCRAAVRVINRRVRRSVAVLESLEPILKTI